MSTIASLISQIDPSAIKPWYEGQQGVNREQIGRQQAQTGLIELQQVREKQAAEQMLFERIKNDPALAQQLFGGSVLGSLGTAPGGPPAAAPGPITQSPLGPGGGPSQQIPAYPDASRFAGVSPTGGGPIPPNVMAQTMPTVTPPPGTPTLATLGPQGGMPGPPQGQMQGPQNPLLEMARRDPRAALALQQQLEGRQDAAMKRQEQQLKMGTQIMDYLGRGAQGVTDQASLDAFREETARVHPQAAASLPQTYSKEAMQPFIAKALDVKEAMTLQVQELTAQAAVIKARKEGRSVDVDNQLRAMGVQPGQETPAQIKEALQAVEDAKVRVSASHGTGQVFDTPEGKMRLRPGTNTVEPLYTPGGQQLQPKPTQAEQETATYSNLAREGHKGAVELETKGFKPGILDKAADKLPLGIGNYLTSDEHQKYKGYVMDFAQAWLRRTSKGAITETEWKFVDERYFPQPGNSKEEIENKRKARENVIKELEAEGKGTGRTGTQAPPTSQGSVKPVGQMSAEETRAEIAAIKARGGR